MSNQTTLTGTLRIIGDVQSFGANGFTKREIVIETVNGSFVDQIPFEMIKDKANLIETFRVGEIITVYYNLRGSENNGRRFLTANVWKVERPNQQGAGQSQSQPQKQPVQNQPAQSQPVQNQHGQVPQQHHQNGQSEQPW